MPGTKIVAFDAHDIVKLWTHYSEGRMPLDAELKALAVDKKLVRCILFIINSKQWADECIPGRDGEYNPLHLRYEGKRILSWGNFGTEPFWQDANETPRYQK